MSHLEFGEKWELLFGFHTKDFLNLSLKQNRSSGYAYSRFLAANMTKIYKKLPQKCETNSKNKTVAVFYKFSYNISTSNLWFNRSTYYNQYYFFFFGFIIFIHTNINLTYENINFIYYDCFKNLSYLQKLELHVEQCFMKNRYTNFKF